MSTNNTGSIDELFYTQRLVNNDISIRMKTFKKLHTFLKTKSLKKGFTYDDLLKIWKGLYYCMYNADQPLVQEDLAERISCLIHQFGKNPQKVLFFKVALDTFAREWGGIDKFRVDKYLMLFTRTIRHSLFFLLSNEWADDLVKKVATAMETSIVCPSDDTNAKPLELKMYLADIILEEILKVSKGVVPDSVLLILIYPFLKVISVSNQQMYVNAIQERILHKLIYESDVDTETGVSVEVEEGKDEDEAKEGDEEKEQEDEGKKENEIKVKEQDKPKQVEEKFVMDPRAGGVDVVLPQLKIDYRVLILTLRSLASIKEISAAKRRILRRHASLFAKISHGEFPFHEVVIHNEAKLKRRMVAKAVKRLEDPEKYEDFEMEDERFRWQRKKPRSEKTKRKRRMFRKGRRSRKEALDILKEQAKGKVLRDKKLKDFPKKFLTSIASEAKFKKDVDIVSKDKVKVVQNKKLKKFPKKIGTSIAFAVQTEAKPVSAEAGMKKKKIKIKKNIHKSTDEGWNVKKIESDTTKVLRSKKRKTETTDPLNPPPTDQLKKAPKRQKTETTSPKAHNKTDKPKPSFEKRIGTPTGTSAEKKKVARTNNGKEKKRRQGALKRIQNGVTPSLPAANAKPTSLPSNASKKSPWDEPLKEGETEIIIRSKKFAQMKNAKSKINLVIKKTPKRNTKGKTLKINLGRNQEHDLNHYTKVLKSSPGIPFSANKKPLSSVLKSDSSPVTTRLSL